MLRGSSGAAARIAARAGTRAPYVMAVVCILASVPGLSDSVRWNVFFGQDDTRTLAARFIEREVPAGSTILVQPYSAPIRQSREGLIEALRASVGDESRAPVKYQLQLQATTFSRPAYRVLYVGESGKTQAPPGDVDKIYISPRAFSGDRGLQALRAARVEYVVLTRYGVTPPALAALQTALEREARRIARFSPYRDNNTEPASAPIPPFRHNSNTGIHAALERPGPLVEIWRIN